MYYARTYLLDHEDQEAASGHARGERVVVLERLPAADENLGGGILAPDLRYLRLDIAHLF